jgi:DNA-binding transcriptional LysR family regulator
VTQPSLTRAIKQLEDELGGDLFRRERPHAQLTELGQRMHPLLKQCYESPLGARSLASAIKSGEVGTLRLGVSRTINPELLTPCLLELNRLFERLELKLLRGTAAEIVELLKCVSNRSRLAIRPLSSGRTKGGMGSPGWGAASPAPYRRSRSTNRSTAAAKSGRFCLAASEKARSCSSSEASMSRTRMKAWSKVSPLTSAIIPALRCVGGNGR